MSNASSPSSSSSSSAYNKPTSSEETLLHDRTITEPTCPRRKARLSLPPPPHGPATSPSPFDARPSRGTDEDDAGYEADLGDLEPSISAARRTEVSCIAAAPVFRYPMEYVCTTVEGEEAGEHSREVTLSWLIWGCFTGWYGGGYVEVD